MFFSSFDKIFCLTGFVFDTVNFHFRAYGKMGIFGVSAAILKIFEFSEPRKK